MNLLKMAVITILTVGSLATGSVRAEVAEAQGAKRVLIVVTNHAVLGNTSIPTGLHLSEFTHPYYAFQDAGLSVDLVSPNGGNAPIDPQSINHDDPSNDRFLQDTQARARLAATLPAAWVEAKNYAAIFYVGGHGTMWDFPESRALAKLAGAIYDRGGVVAAICHGPSGLLNIKLKNGSYLISGKELTALTNEEELIGGRSQIVPFSLETELISRGAHFKKVNPWGSYVIVSDRLITGQNPESAAEISDKFIEMVR